LTADRFADMKSGEGRAQVLMTEQAADVRGLLLAALLMITTPVFGQTASPAAPPNPVVGVPGSVVINAPVVLKDSGGCAYPAEAIKTRTEGATVVHAHISAEGVPTQVSIAGSSGSTLLDAAALKCFPDWRFKPATRDGAAIPFDWDTRVIWKVPPMTCEEASRPRMGDPPPKPAAPPAQPGKAPPELIVCLCTDLSGLAQKPVIVESSGDRDLDKKAVKGFSDWDATHPGGPGCTNIRVRMAGPK
jgi:TonB family protein